MNDTFRLTVHWAERIVEIRCPAMPTMAAWTRLDQEVRTAVGRLGFGWKCLVEDAPIVDMPDEMAVAISKLVVWSVEHGLVMAARVTKVGGVVDLKLAKVKSTPGLIRAAGTPFVTREAAWAALLAGPAADAKKAAAVDARR